MKRIKKIRYKDGEGVIIVYANTAQGDTGLIDTITLKSEDLPEQELIATLAGMNKPLVRIVNLPEKITKDVRILSTSYRYDENSNLIKICFSATKKITGQNTPLVINSPYIDYDYFHVEEKQEIEKLAKLGIEFLDGARSQLGLFDQEEGEEEEEYEEDEETKHISRKKKAV
ncbi:MAG: hypothetical protein FWF38_00380 [Spirochaetaceae bacterium]|nr:hypothetical protein [Spirochaetaceae bacterium]